jgi:hypothetical protein
VVSTWIHCDSPDQESSYPSATGHGGSAAESVYDIYWRCVACLFASSRRVNPGAEHRLYTNMAQPPCVDDVDLQDLFRKWEIEIVVLPIRHIPPPDWWGAWRNQFYIFDILHHVAQHNSGEAHLILDSDCLILSALADLFEDVSRRRALALDCGYGADYVINGLTRRDMQGLFSALDGRECCDAPAYAGGEIVAASSEFIREIDACVDSVWSTQFEWHRQKRRKFNEEAHMLSYLYHKLHVSTGTANRYIKRMWTGLSYRNVRAEDTALAIWHLPAEKRYGFKRLFRHVVQEGSWFHQAEAPDFRRRTGAFMGVPARSVKKNVLDIASKVYNRLSPQT